MVFEHRYIGCLGGTFDPVHYGHLAVAAHARLSLRLDEIRFIPAGTPVHRGVPGASPEDRLAMLRLALDGQPDMAVDEREMLNARAGQPNYTLYTLQSLHADTPEAILYWIIGDDAFAALTTWYQWQQLFDYAHFVVVTREKHQTRHQARFELPETLHTFIQGRKATSAEALRRQKSGLVYHLPMPPHTASATAIRVAVAENHSERIRDLLPATVLAYIAQHRLYRA